MLDITQKVTFADTIFAQEVDGEMVLLDMESENYFGLDAVGTDIWQQIETHEGDLQKVFDALLQMYEVDEERLRQDLLTFVERLTQSGLVKVVAA